MLYHDYDQKPKIELDFYSDALTSYKLIANKIKEGIFLVETYPGVRINEIIINLKKNNYQGQVIITDQFSKHTKKSFRNEIFEDLTNDRIFGKLSEKNYSTYFDQNKISSFVKNNQQQNMVVIGICAYLFNFKNSKLIYADMPRWEIQSRYRNKEKVFFKGGLENDTLQNFKRGYFIEWRMADRIKKHIWNKIDYFLDTTKENSPILMNSLLINTALKNTSTRPFRLVPYFDYGVWGGNWMSKNFHLTANKYGKWAWGFDGVPEENSLMFLFKDNVVFELPAINLVFRHPKELLGPRVWNRFGEEFPIRFDFLDTIGGKNLSLQVHPTTQYIRDQFRMPYTQEESYYILDVDEHENPTCYLGLKDGVSINEFVCALNQAQTTNTIDVEKYVNRFKVKKHDHLLHPSGCVHASASGCMVLEISTTPYIFTFKLWDWGRLDLDGKPRPINIEHGKNVIQEEFRTDFCLKELVSQFKVLEENEFYKKERTGLHSTQYIETIRHTIKNINGIVIYTNDSVNMLNLVDGKSIMIESPNNEFNPIKINYGETFIVPEYCKQYLVRPIDCSTVMLIQAFVRTNP